jgi:hypothetical protein
VDDAHAELQKDAWTLKDSSMNELIRTLLGDAGSQLLEKTDVLEILAKNLRLNLTDKEGDRFGKE